MEVEGSGGRVWSGGSVAGGCVGVPGCGCRVGLVWGVWGVRGVVQDRMKRDASEEVFDHESGGMLIANCHNYTTSYFVEGIKYWDPESGRKCCLVSTNVSNRRSGIRLRGWHGEEAGG